MHRLRVTATSSPSTGTEVAAPVLPYETKPLPGPGLRTGLSSTAYSRLGPQRQPRVDVIVEQGLKYSLSSITKHTMPPKTRSKGAGRRWGIGWQSG